MLCGTNNIQHNILIFRLLMGILCVILLVPHNIVIDMNNDMPFVERLLYALFDMWKADQRN